MIPAEIDWFDWLIEIWTQSVPLVGRKGLEGKLRAYAKKIGILDDEIREYLGSREQKLQDYENKTNNIT
jgi:hypothetical protein